MQPVQLSLLPDQVSAPLPELISQLPEENITRAVTQLARLIAAMQATKEAGDER